MPFCTQCGVKGTGKFCISCGYALGGGSAAAKPATDISKIDYSGMNAKFMLGEDQGICVKCNKMIKGRAVRGVDGPRCPDCFTCSMCDIKVNPDLYSERNGKPVCDACAKANPIRKSGGSGGGGVNVCPTCQKPLSGNVIDYDGKTYHSGCFVCGGCQNTLQQGQFSDTSAGLRCSKCKSLGGSWFKGGPREKVSDALCGKCGRENEETKKFCKYCGEKLFR